MEIEQYHRKQRLLASAGGVIASPSSSWSELERAGDTLTQIGLESEKERLKTQYYDQINSARLQVAKKFEEYQDTLEPDNTDKWIDDLENIQRTYDEIKLTNERAAADFSILLEEEKFRQKKSIADYRRAIDARNFQANYYINKNEFMEIASKARTPGEFDQLALASLKSLFGLQLKEDAEEITQENLETAEDFDNPLFKTEELRINEAMAWLKDASSFYEAEQMQNIFGAAADTLKQFTERQQAIDFIDNVLVNVLSREQRNDLLAITNRRFDGIEVLAKIKLKEQQDKNNRESFVKIRRGELIEPDEIENMILSEELTMPAGKALLEMMGRGSAKNDDPKAVRSANKIIDQVGRGEIEADEGFIELEKLGPGLKPTTMTTKVNQFSDAEDPDNIINSPRAKEYLERFDDLLDDGDITVEEWDRLKSEFRAFIKENPKGTAKEWADYFEALTYPAVHNWLYKLFTREPKFPEIESEEEDISKMTDDELRAIIEGG